MSTLIETLAQTLAHASEPGWGEDHNPDRYEVRERIRGTKTDVATHERFGAEVIAHHYAADRTEHEPAMYGADAAHELVVVDTRGRWHL
jgi:hypothetical protein